MKVMKKGHQEDGKRFGGTFPMEAELDQATVDVHTKMADGLRELGAALMEQCKTHRGAEVVGVEFHHVSFSFMLGPRG